MMVPMMDRISLEGNTEEVPDMAPTLMTAPTLPLSIEAPRWSAPQTYQWAVGNQGIIMSALSEQ